MSFRKALFALEQADQEGAGPVYTTLLWQNWNAVFDTKVPFYDCATVKLFMTERHGHKIVHVFDDSWSEVHIKVA